MSQSSAMLALSIRPTLSFPTSLFSASAPWGFQAQRPFCPPFLVGKTPAVMTFHVFQRADLCSY